MRCTRVIIYCTGVVFGVVLGLQGQKGPVRIEVTPANSAVAPAANQQFDAFRLDLGALNKSGGRLKVTNSVKWTSSDPTIAGVDSSGSVTGVSLGFCTITATSGPLRGSTVVHVSTTGTFCGDDILQTANGEQCDDGGNANLDGCSATCKFEQNQRMKSLSIPAGASGPFCTSNAFGHAIIGFAAQTAIQSAIDTNIRNGSISLLFAMLNITDLTGVNEPAYSMGVLTGTPVSGSGYDGSSDFDWWYHPNLADIDGSRVPKNKLTATISSNLLTTSPGNLSLPFLGGALNLSNVQIQATTSATAFPTASAGSPPGYLASENIDPALVSYAEMGAGSMCGRISASSLALTPVPSAITNCSQGYTANNSLLDVLVGGCTVPIFGTQVTPTQPDTFDPAAPAAGAGAPYTLAENGSHQVSSCKDKSNNPVSLSVCLSAAAYSSWFVFATDRVIIK